MLMKKYGIPTANFKVFTGYKEALLYAQSQKYPLVVKADGQCLGKGVVVAKNFNQAKAFIHKLLIDKVFGSSGKKIIIEECLTGQEISFMVATDGKDFVSLLTSQDHKRIFDNDRGPNTGGMGAYAPVPFVDKKLIGRIETEIVAPTLFALKKEECDYNGILYPGLILTKEGPKVLEFNCRFGDPETQPVLSLLKTDLIDVFQSILKKQISRLKLSWIRGFSVCVVVASKGYPGVYEKGIPITFARAALNKNFATIFHAGTKLIDKKTITTGGRVLGITGIGKSLKEAIKNSYKAIDRKIVSFSGMQYRRDIGQKGLNKNLWQ